MLDRDRDKGTVLECCRVQCRQSYIDGEDGVACVGEEM